jgi:hypothetical protein
VTQFYLRESQGQGLRVETVRSVPEGIALADFPRQARSYESKLSSDSLHFITVFPVKRKCIDDKTDDSRGALFLHPPTYLSYQSRLLSN